MLYQLEYQKRIWIPRQEVAASLPRPYGSARASTVASAAAAPSHTCQCENSPDGMANCRSI